MCEIKLGHKILNFLREADRIVNDNYQMPVTFEVDASNYCQNDCGFCMFAHHLKENRVHLPMGLYYKALNSFRHMGVKSITFTGGGEPLMNPNIRKMIRLAFEDGLKVGLVSNGVLLDEIFGMSHMLEYVRISVDSASPEVYTKVKGRDYFEKVISNIAQLALIGATDVGMSFVITKENKHEVTAFAKLAKDLNVHYAQVKPELKVCDMESQTKNINNDGLFLTERYNIDSNDLTQCKIAGLVGILGATGKAYYCCVHRGKKEFEIGDLAKQELKEIFVERSFFKPPINMCQTSCRYMNYSKIYEQVRDKRFTPLRHKEFI